MIKAENYNYPYSRGLLATRMMVTGLDLVDAYKTAEAIAVELELEDTWELTEIELNNFVSDILEKEGKILHAARYRNFLKFKNMYQPLIILIGGATGIGKSTIALDLAARLAISHIVGTDTIREVMRKVLSTELVPSLHSSSYAAHESMKEYVSPIYNRSVIGFEEQARLVVSGIESVIARALTEGISIIIDGVHILPSIMDPKLLKSPNIIPVFLHLSSEEDHMMRFHERAKTQVMRKPLEDYLEHFEGIRTIQDHLLEQARIHGIPLIENMLIEPTIRQILDVVFERIEMITTPSTS
jgi:2-phosphoglycerate kinase